MPNPIVPKKSSTPGAVPTSGQLLTGEIAANTADGKLFIKKSDGTVTAVSGSGGTIEYATSASFPATGQTSVVYVATDVSRAYRWTGSEYVEIGPIAALPRSDELFPPFFFC